MYALSSEWYLESDEQPVKLEQQFFEALGYTYDDKLEQQGRKDHGYLFSFIYSDRPRNHDKPVCFTPTHAQTNTGIVLQLNSPISFLAPSNW